jgi:hypothetical protein
MSQVRVTRDVAADENHNYLGRAAAKGEVFYVFIGHTYGCVRTRLDVTGGLALSEHGPTIYPFFEFPCDAIEAIP